MKNKILPLSLVTLVIFLAAFFIKRIGAHAAFIAAVIAQISVLIIYFTDIIEIGYLWYNLIACAMVIVLSLVIQAFVKENATT